METKETGGGLEIGRWEVEKRHSYDN